MSNVYRSLLYAAAIAASLSLCHTAEGQTAERYSLGLYNSIRGIGLSLFEQREDLSFNSYSLTADLFGVLNGRTDVPGLHFNFSRNYYLMSSGDERCNFLLFSGPGATIAYTRDYEKGYYNREHFGPFEKNPGVVLALSASFGCRFVFRRRIELQLSWLLETGLHLRQDEELPQTKVSFYRNGVLRAPYPILHVTYRFR
jgi:hypothetical protein